MNVVQTGLVDRFARVRSASVSLLDTLHPEDVGLQAAPHASPPKWHVAHTTWFFDTFVLAPFQPGYVPFDPAYAYLFNSYYESAGARQPRARRGDLSRPLLRDVLVYRAHVDAAVTELLLTAHGADASEIARRVSLGLHHEEQHQELLVMDVKVHFGVQPLLPAFRPERLEACVDPGEARWVSVEGGVVSIGHEGAGFAYDNESPRHQVLLSPFALASRCITNAEWKAFVDDGGYRTPSLWLSDGWAWVQEEGVEAPEYWRADGEGGWGEFTVAGLGDLDPHAPVVHVSGFEAEAYAAWAGARLPTEFEWEAASASVSDTREGTFLDDGRWHPRAATHGAGLRQLFGDVWEWTRSAYLPYPGFKPLDGALGEYNGKFMSSQWVLRGGCCASPRGHVRRTYRNFFYPQQRWMFGGLRLARDA